jgi:O-antigen/teichoic acid export membrane protein
VADPTPTSGGAARNTLFAFLTQMVTAAFTAGLTIFLVRKLGPREFGLFSLAVSVGGLVFLPSDFGVSGSASRFIAERRSDRSAVASLMSDALRLKLAISGGVSVVLILIAPLVADAYGEPSLMWPIRWVALAILGQGLVALYRYAFVAQRRASVGLQIVFCESAVEVAASVAIVLTAGGAAGAAAGRAAGYAFGTLAAVIITLRQFGAPAFLRSERLVVARRKLARYAGALFVIDAAFAASVQASPLIIGAFLGPKAVGLFQAPARLIVLLQYPGVSIANGVAPGLARGEGREPEVATYAAALRYLIAFQSLAVAPILVWAGPIVELLLGDGYGRSAEILRELTPYVFMSGLAALVATSVDYLGGARLRVPIALLDLAISLGLTAALVPAMGLDGAALATDVGALLYVPLHIWVTRRFIDVPVRPLLRAAARGLASAGAMSLVLLAFGTHDLSALDWIGGAVLGLAAFFAVLIGTGEVTVAELRALPRYIRRRARR